MNTNRLRLATIFVSLATMLYALLRAIMLDITYDEAWSIGTYVNGPFRNIFLYEPCDSNNHLINSFLIKCLFFILPENTFVARLPGLLSLLVYLYFSSKLSRSNASIAGFLIFVLFLLNPFLLEFFSLARGYAFSMAAVSMSLYYFEQYRQDLKKRSLSWSLVAAALAGISVFSFLNFFAGLLVLSFIHLLVQRKKNYLQVLSLQFTTATLVTLLLWVPFQRLTQFGNLYYGGKTGLWQDTLLSLGRYSQYKMFETSATTIITTLVFFLLLTFVLTILIRNKSANVESTWGLQLFVYCLLINLLQVKVINGFYLIDRTALFLYPIVILILWQVLQTEALRRWLVNGVLILALLFGLNTLSAMNLNKTLTWFFDSHTREILTELDSQGKKENRVIAVGCSWPFEKTLVWYLKQGKYPNVTFRWDPDYYVYLDSPLDQIDYYPSQEQLLPFRSGVVAAFPEEHVFVLKR